MSWLRLTNDRLPYDRTWLSKYYFTGKVTKEQLPLRSSQFFQNHNIEVLLKKFAVCVDAIAKTITFADEDKLSYDALLLATGGKPSQLDVSGKDLQNIFTLRSFSDIEKILAAAGQAKKAVVIGSSFIGMETASGLRQKGLAVTVVSPDSLPFKKILGEEIGKVFQQVHESNGVSFRMERKVTEIVGDGKVETVILDNGDRLDADMVVVGIGVSPATEFLQGVELNPKDRSVPVAESGGDFTTGVPPVDPQLFKTDEYLQAADSLYGAGDIASFPDWRTSESTRIEHWRIAAQHGRIAAYNMAGKSVKFRGVPVFWTMQFQFPLRYVGHAEDWDEIIFNGDLQKQEFIAFYIKNNQVLAAASSQRDTETAAICELLRRNQMPSPEKLRDSDLDLIALLQQ